MAWYTLEEVEEEARNGKVLVFRDRHVYDVTQFVERHPGGSAVLRDNNTRQVSKLMKGETAAHSHSPAAYKILEKYVVGQLRKKEDYKTAEVEEDEDLDMTGWKENELIDWSQPLLWQVGCLGKEYMNWVHSPVDKKIRFFASDVLEYFSTCSWYIIPAVWIPVMCVYLVLSYRNFHDHGPEHWLPWLCGGIWISIYYMPVLFVMGMLMWSFMEYVIHRWCFHLMPPPSSPVLITFHFLIHGQHHKAPMDKDRLVFPPVPASFFGIAFSTVYLSVFPLAIAQCLLAGTALGYVVYDLMHYYLHHGSPKMAYLKDLKHCHVQHHFTHQEKAFGISSKLWDYPFGTLMPSDKTKQE